MEGKRGAIQTVDSWGHQANLGIGQTLFPQPGENEDIKGKHSRVMRWHLHIFQLGLLVLGCLLVCFRESVKEK